MADLTVGYAADGTPKTYTTLAAAFAAANDMDNLQLYYANATKRRTFFENISNGTTKGVSLEGMLADRQVGLVTNDDFYYVNGDMSGISSQLVIQNLRIRNFSAGNLSNNGITWRDTVGGGEGFRITNCEIGGFALGIYPRQGDANVVQVDNCLIHTCGTGIYATMAAKVYYTTVVRCGEGIENNSVAGTYTNVVAADNITDWKELTNATVTYCCSGDATLNGVGSNNIYSKTMDDLKWWGDQATAQAHDWRIVDTSDLVGAGTPVAGLTTDCDGNARDGSTPSMGWHEGTAGAYEISATAPNAPDVSVARVDDTTARVTFSNSDPDVTNRVRYATVGDGGDNWSDGGSRSGDGTVDVSGLTLGQTYYLLGFSDSAGAYSEPSNVAIYTAGSASGATGAYAQFISDLHDEVRNSAALAAKVTSGAPADHVKLGRFLNIDTDSKRHAALIANGPVVYLEPRPYSKAPRSGEHNRCKFSAVLQVFESYDASTADTLITALSFVEALTREIMAESDGAGASWAASGCDVRVSIDGPREIAGLRDELVTSVSITANWTEEL